MTPDQEVDDKICKLGSQLVPADSKAGVAHTAAKTARKAADIANMSMELAQNYQRSFRL
jgi:hypothetical protein